MIVMKFGGTSVGSPEAIIRTAEIIRTARERGPIAVVVSAMSGITDRLLAAADDARFRRRSSATAIAELRAHHVDCCEKLELENASEILAPLHELSEVLNGIYALRELTERSRDFVVSHGEQLSSRILAAWLDQNGTPARAVCGWESGVMTDERHGGAAILESTWTEIPKRLPDPIAAIPIITGFVGVSPTGERTTLGRGGSDYTAAIFGRALKADEIQIWTDVSGILSTDPRIVPTATPLAEVTFEEAAELAYFGAKVIHPKTIEPAVAAGIVVRVLNTFAPNDPGTRIVRRNREAQRDPSSRVVSGIAVKRNNTILTLDSTRMLDAEGYLARVFDELRDKEISVDAIATSEVSVCMTVEAQYSEALERAAVNLASFAQVDLRPGRSIICVVGTGMRDCPGTAAKIFAAVHAAEVNIEMISMGSSKINLTFVVADEDADTALRYLHKRLIEDAGR